MRGRPGQQLLVCLFCLPATKPAKSPAKCIGWLNMNSTICISQSSNLSYCRHISLMCGWPDCIFVSLKDCTAPFDNACCLAVLNMIAFAFNQDTNQFVQNCVFIIYGFKRIWKNQLNSTFYLESALQTALETNLHNHTEHTDSPAICFSFVDTLAHASNATIFLF